MVKVSVVIPVYNVEKYLEECLDSIVNQTLKDIEIICVNDGSTDSSLEILERYQKSDERIRIFSQENKRAGAARNLGLSHSNGDYVYFMDSDDILELTALEELYQISQEKETDFIIFKLINFYDEGRDTFTTPYYEMAELHKKVGENVFSHWDLGNYVFYLSVNPQGKFFKRTAISHLRFPEHVIFEDNIFFMEAVFDAERIYFYNKHLCNRRIRETSLTNNASERYIDVIYILNKLFDITRERNLFEFYKDPLYNRKMINSFARFTQVGEDIKPKFFEALKNDFLSHKEEYEADEDFLKVLTPKAEYIFYKAISADNYKEFELDVNLFEAEENIKKLEKSLSKTKKKIKELEKSNKSLKKEIKEVKNKNNQIKSTKSYRLMNFYSKSGDEK